MNVFREIAIWGDGSIPLYTFFCTHLFLFLLRDLTSSFRSKYDRCHECKYHTVEDNAEKYWYVEHNVGVLLINEAPVGA